MKKLLTVCLSAVMALSVVACGGGNSTQETSSGASTGDVLVKHFCNTLFDKYLCIASFHWC